jgi:hypothetical protein
MTARITQKLVTFALTEAMGLAWKLIYGGERVGRAGRRLEGVVERNANRLGIDIYDVLTHRVDPRLC